MEDLGILSVVPPLMAIILALITRQVLPALFVSIWIGASILSGGNIFTGFAKTIEHYIAGSIADEWNAGIIAFDIGLGGMIGIVAKSGGAKAIAEWLGKKAKNPKGGQLATWTMGLAIFFDDYSNTLLVGNTMRPLTDKLRVSREKLSYICDSTAAPVASMALISTWIAYEMGLLRDAFTTIGLDMNSYAAFIKSIPYRFYSITALFFVLAIVLLGRDFGPMLRAEIRARLTGKVVGDGATPLASKELTEMEIKEGTPLRTYNALIPVFTVIFMVIFGLYINGYNAIMGGENTELIARIKANPLAFTSVRDIIGNANAAVAMMWASYSGTIVAMVLVLTQRILTFKEAVEAWIDGAKSLVIALMVLVLAWSIGRLCKDLGTADYLVSILEGNISPRIIPLAVFILGCLIAFSTGTSWGTTAILMPIAVPLVYHLSGGDTGSLLFATIGAVFTGAVFGDHCSPISDTTIMSSMASASDHIDHVKTQAPYAITTAVIAAVVGYIPSAFGIHPLISIIVGIACAFTVVRVVGKKVEEIV
ncbi:Na+/H+ antiporter NhaC family protein [Thermohalobacter berrensis]|uniref:Sodium:proton antiporter n=1 Tax=Thermohalobacter berrensis TaxID=99594 RepID=A0A419T7I1_9FIRM|nr:Na+/H+ antiporter NhaC family protein [Thermohalobacter berrensis]RKD33514.1 sodium:proton antiporter [Thermohalobacter berrensis]